MLLPDGEPQRAAGVFKTASLHLSMATELAGGVVKGKKLFLGKADFSCTPAPKDLPLKMHVSLPNLHRQAVSVDGDLKADGGR